MHRLLSLIPAFRPSRNSGIPAGMRGKSVSTIHVPEYTGRAAGCCERQPAVSNETASPPPGQSRFRRSLFALCVSLLMLVLPFAAFAATPPGTQIDNSATATYNSTDTATSNLVSITTVLQRTPSTITFLQYAPTSPPGSQTVTVPATSYSTTGDLTSPAPLQAVGPNGLPNTLPLIEAQAYHAGAPLYISLEDQDQNLDPTTAETVLVRITCVETGDDELLLLTEGGTDSGIFFGYVLSEAGSQVLRNGILAVTTNSTLNAYYVDATDGQDESADAILIDPYGFVFDSVTGAPIDGALVTLFDVTAGQPATVFYDDGSPGYPATVTTSDASLGFPTGGYRFPLIQPGRDYRLDIESPSGYGAPSQAPPDVLRNQFGSQYAIEDQASYGGTFPVNLGPVIRIDIPADPDSSGLWLTKDATQSVVAIGDFLQYTLVLENLNSSGTATAVTIEDHLPAGFRYQKDSLEIDGSKASDPRVSSDGRTLSISVGDLTAGQSVMLSYVVEVTAGAETGDAINRAIANTQIGTTSNLATARVTVRDDFFRNQALILGRVMIGACETPDTDKEGLAGARIYLEDGSYVITDGEGKYHYEGIEPGVHVVQLDLDTLPPTYEVLPCEENSQFAGRAFSQFVDLQGGSLWRADFHIDLKPKQQGQATIELSGSLVDDQADFRIPLKVAGVALDNLRLSVILPEGVEYLPGSSTLNGVTLADPEARGPVHTYRLGARDAGWSGELALGTRVTKTSHGELPTKAVLTFNTPQKNNQRTPMAETLLLIEATESRTPLTKFDVRPNFPTLVATLSETDKLFFDQLAEELRDYEIDRLYAIGHTDNVRIAPRNRHLFADNQALSEARANHVARYLGSELNLPPAKVVVTGKADRQPFTDNDSEKNRSLNRRVEIRIEGEKIDRTLVIDMVRTHSGPQTVKTIGLRPGEVPEQDRPAESEMISTEMPDYDEQWLAQADPGFEWLWPPEDQVPAIPSIKIAIKHQPDQKLTLLLEGGPVSTLAFEGTIQNASGQVAVSTWRGVGIEKGSNRFELIISDADGHELERISKSIHYAHIPAHTEVLIEESTLIADGRTAPVIAIRLTDKEGFPISQGMVGDFSVSPPFSALIDNEQEMAGTFELHQPRYQVGRDGIARIRLEPTPQTGEVTISVPVEDGREELRAWLKPDSREWILVGFAEQTFGYNTLSGKQVNLDDAGIDEHYYDDGRVKFFAKGAIKGEWLLTLAYDSDKPDFDGDSLYQIIDPDTYYPLYGDGTQQGYEASSARDIYIKLERDQFYALFGDMHTGLTRTELSRYSRSLNGFKSELQTRDFSYTMFAADTKQAFVKDEFQGDGTSGRYYLSNKDLVINSEEVTIETRDRFHSERVLETVTLQRHVDYDIDYDNGSLFFKVPVPSRDASFNHNIIVIRYEAQDSKDENFNYGGRVAVKVIDQKVELGATYVHENSGAGDGDLYGVDATIDLTPQTRLHIEAAATDTEEYDDEQSDEAYLAELEHRSNKLQARSYYREYGKQFGLGQQNDSESGTRKYGAEASYQFTPHYSLAGLAYHEKNLVTGAKRDVGELDALYRADRFGMHTGVREARDRMGDGNTQRSTQWLLGGNWMTPDRRLNLRADYEQSIKSSDENKAYPTLVTFGVDYKLTERVTVFAEQELTWGDDQDTQDTRAGFKATPWQGGDLHSSIERSLDENGQRISSIFGLGQTWQLSRDWSVSASLDRSYTIKQSDKDRLNSNVPPVHGSDDDFTAVSLGAAYQVEKWSWWNRLETRQADSEDKYGVSTSVVGEPRKGIAVSAKALAFITDAAKGARTTDGDIRLGFAYRPTRSRWIVLDRMDFYFERQENTPNGYNNWRLVNNIHANFKLSHRLQFSFYYGLKYVRENFSGTRYDGFTDLISFETRYNINKRWDVGVHGSVLHSWNSDQFDYSAGADLGYSPMTNTWVSLGYNVVGFEDEDFDDANYTAQGAYMRFRMKFDQQSVREAAEWINR